MSKRQELGCNIAAAAIERRQSRNGAAYATMVAALAALLALGGVLGIVLSHPKPVPKVLGAYLVGLKERTPHQRHNACLAASRLSGVIIPAGSTFSFNQALGGWTASQGYLKAPVSYDGVLIDDYGGGVCETSTVLYNAALLSGLTVVERHAHTFAPSYVQPGRDAAVAYSNIDLRVRNPYAEPVSLIFRADHDDLVCRVEGDVPSHPIVNISTQIMDRFAAPIVPPGHGVESTTAKWFVHGREGLRVVVYRDTMDFSGSSLDRRLVSDNTYQPMAGVR